jgi:hypothetical protein
LVCHIAPASSVANHTKPITVKNQKYIPLAFAVLSLSSFLPASAQVLAAWTFSNDAVATNNAPATSSGTGTADSIGMNVYPTPNVGITQDDVVLGKSSDTGLNGVADTTNTWRVRGQAGANGAANGWSSAAPIGTQGAQFFTSTVGDTAPINVSFDWYATSAGEANLQLEYTINGGTTWNNLTVTLSGSDSGVTVKTNTTSANTILGSYLSITAVPTSVNANNGQDWFTDLTATITDPLAENNSQFGIEMVNASTGADDVNTAGTALNNPSCNWRFDNISISEAPEPGTCALLGLGGLLVLAWRRRGTSVGL